MMAVRTKIADTRRPLGGTEKIYWLLDKLYCLNFVAYVELSGELEAANLDEALSAVQEENPLLRARITLEGKVPVFAPVSITDCPLQVEERKLQGWRKQLDELLNDRFPLDRAPLTRVFWFRGKGKNSVLAFLFHHPIADGRSGVSVLRDVVQRVTTPTKRITHRPARPSAQDLDLISQQPVVRGKLKEIRFWLDRGRELLRFAQGLPGYDMQPREKRVIASMSRVIPVTRTAKILAACKEHHASMHGVLGASQLLALNKEFRKEEPRVLALNSLADLRGVIDGKLTERDLGLYVSTLTTLHNVESDADFWRLAAEIRDQLRQIISSGDANLIHSFYPHKRFFTPDERGARKVQAIVALAPPSSMLTNIGRIDPVPTGSGISIRGIGFLLAPPAQCPICVTANSYEGRLFLNLLYDREKIDNRQAGRIFANLVGYVEAAATEGHDTIVQRVQ